MKILVIEDDAETAAYIANGLKELGHVVDLAATGRDGLFMAAGESYDLLVVDRMLPQLDGISVVKTIRGGGVTTPVLFLTALGGVDDRIAGLDAGGDDYLVKPFSFSELVARINALAPRRPCCGSRISRWTSSSARWSATARHWICSHASSACSSSSCGTPARW